jgi:hypothetical protein
LSVLEDLDTNDGTPGKEYMMSDNLKQLMRKVNDKVDQKKIDSL